MSKKRICLITSVIVIICMMMTACGDNLQASDLLEAASANTEVTQEQVLAEMSDEQKNWMGGLDEARRLEDLTSLCDGLRENYPYLVLAKRQAGADIDVLEETYREKIRRLKISLSFILPHSIILFHIRRMVQ